MAELSQNRPIENVGTLLDELTNQKREIYFITDQALECDQALTDKRDQALKPEDYETVIYLYQKSLKLTEKALFFHSQHQQKLSSFTEAQQTISKINSIKSQAIERINVLHSKINTLKTSDIDLKFLDLGEDVLLVDDFDDQIVVVDTPSEPENESKEMATASSLVEKSKKAAFDLTESKTATEIMKLDNCARMFYIGTDGSVSTPSNLKNISIYSFEQNQAVNKANDKKILGFVKCGDWMHPLLPNENPGMKTNFNAYIFPNNDPGLSVHCVNPSAECSFVGVTFEKNNLMNEQVLFFEDVLKNFNSLVYQDTSKSTDVKIPHFNEKLDSSSVIVDGSGKAQEVKPVPKTWSAEYISDGIVTGAGYVSKGVAAGTEYASKYMGLGGEKLKSSLTPNAVPTKMSPAVKKSTELVRSGTNLTVKVSGYLVDKLGSLVSATAKKSAPVIRKGATSLMTTSGVASNKENANNTMDDICKVGSGGIKGIVMVWSSLEDAAMTLGKNFTEQTVTVVDHKYGKDAAEVTENGLYSAGNIAISVNNYKGLKIKKVGKAFVKEAAKETVISYKEDKNSKELKKE